MEYALKERIGKPELFTGRKEELAFFLNWINNIKEEKSKSTAILSRRKMGKTALMERLFNITFHNNDGIIPFYYEVQKSQMWVVDFCTDFFLTFIYQYMAFKTRKTEYLDPMERVDLEEIKHLAEKEGLPDLPELISSVKRAIDQESVDTLWLIVRNAPRTLAARRGEFIVQMIDEFQFLNAMIYWDKKKERPATGFAAGYMSTAESKVAPLLVSGSWVGWLMHDLSMMLPARFRFKFFKNMPADEAAEMVFKYSGFFNVPVTEETAYLIAQMAEGNPFYISSILNSNVRGKNLTTIQGLTETLEFEILNDEGNIKSTWMEYLKTAFHEVNQKNAKNIVLYLCQHRDRQVSRKELLEKLSLDMTDPVLEDKMDALIKADIIDGGQSSAEYQGVQDNIFDKVFRGKYAKEIQDFDVKVIGQEIHHSFEELKKQYHRLLGEYNYQKGYFAEYVIINLLKHRARKLNDLLKSITRYLPADFIFCDYAQVWSYDSAIQYGHEFNVDIFALPKSATDYAIIGEVKNRETKKFSKKEVLSFMEKFAAVKKRENLQRVIPFIFSLPGFTKEAERYCQEMGIALSQDGRWLE